MPTDRIVADGSRVYIGGHAAPFRPGDVLPLPDGVAAELEAAGHLRKAEPAPMPAEPSGAEPPAA